MGIKVKIHEEEDGTLFEFTEDRDECPVNAEDRHEWVAGRPVVLKGTTPGWGPWEAIFPIRCAACGLTAQSEVGASDHGFINYDAEIQEVKALTSS